MISVESIAQVGFPIAVCVYLLYERQQVLTELIKENNENNSKLTKAINDLRITIIREIH